MNSPQFKEGNLDCCNEKQGPLYELRRTNIRSLIGLHISQALLFSGFILILLNNLNVIAPGSYFGVYSWVTVAVFSIGLFINFVSIPHLYYSSYRNFIKEDDFWDKETFWILPLFFFGTFFLYNSQISTALLLMVISFLVISIIHSRFTLSSWKSLKAAYNEYSPHHQYFMTLKYLTVYYVLLVMFTLMFNPLQHVFAWIRNSN